MTSPLSLTTFLFWAIAGFMTFLVCIMNAYKTRGGRFSIAFILLGVGSLFLATSAIVSTFFQISLGQNATQLLHDGGFVVGFILLLSASNRFLKAMTG
ncbi:MAG: hypothetical protein AB1352_03660 [Patescibacteria group bacterium]